MWFVALFFVAAVGSGLWMLEENATYRVIIAAGPAEGEAFAVARAIAETTEKYHPEIDVDVVETLGSQQNIELLESRRVQLATIEADTDIAPSARMIALLYPDVFQLVVREDSGIRSVADLKGHKVAIPPEGSGQDLSFWFLAEHYGLGRSDIQALPVSIKAANWAFMDGAVDAVFRVRAAGSRSLLDVVQGVACRWIPIEQALAMRLKKSALEVGSIPSGSYRGHPALPQTDLPSVGVQRVLVAGNDFDEELAGKVTAVLFERRRELVNHTPLAGFIAPPDRGGGTFIPVHRGADAFYNRDEPSFVQKNAEPIALCVTLAALMVSGVLQIRSRRKQRRVDQYNRTLLRLGAEARTLSSVDAVRDRGERLFEIAGRVVDDAEAGQISPEGFTFFSFVWEMVRDRVHEREEELLSTGDRTAAERPLP